MKGSARRCGASMQGNTHQTVNARGRVRPETGGHQNPDGPVEDLKGFEEPRFRKLLFLIDIRRYASFSSLTSDDFRDSSSSGLITFIILLLAADGVHQKPRQREGRQMPTFAVLINCRMSKNPDGFFSSSRS